MSDLSDEWIQKNFRGVINALERTDKKYAEAMETIQGLQRSHAMLNMEIATLKQRMAVMQHGQVMGRTDVD